MKENVQKDTVLELPGDAAGEAEGWDGAQKMLEALILRANHAAHEAEAKLLVEEKGNNVAWLQGFCAGIRAYKVAANDAGFDLSPKLYDTANRAIPWVQDAESGYGENDTDGDTFCILDLNELRVCCYSIDALTRDEHYAELQETMQKEISGKKDFLYGEAKTSRDLFWTHGWSRGFGWVDWQIKEMRFWKGVKEQQKAEELPFEE